MSASLMSVPANKIVFAAALVSVLMVGCRNTALVKPSPPEESWQSDTHDSIPVLYPARFSIRLQNGASGTLLPEDVDAQLRPLLQQLDQWQQVTRIVVTGHTDGEGSEKSNLLLSLRRANAVADKLVDYGISAAVLEVDGRGEQVPVADNNSISGRKLNRRIEVIASGLVTASQRVALGTH